MPIYTFKCSEHGEKEMRLPIADLDQERRCHCGRTMVRLPTVASIRVPKGGREVVLDTLNREHKGTPTRETLLMAAGLEEPKRHSF